MNRKQRRAQGRSYISHSDDEYRVLLVDDDGTIQLENISMNRRARLNDDMAYSTVWVTCDTALRKGQLCKGSFAHNPKLSISLGFPKFIVT